MKNYEELKKAFEKLNVNRWYWEMDNDYKEYFRIIKNGVENWRGTSKDSRTYILDIARHMLRANKRIFKA